MATMEEAKMDVAPKVSVVMCTHGAAATLPSAIASVLRQTCRDLEVIVADDASRDESCEIVRGLGAMDERVRLLTSPVNRGPSAARNRAIDDARGEWVAIVDSDDLIHPNRLERLIEAAEAHGADMVADDVVPFGDTPGIGGSTFFAGIANGRGLIINAAEFVRSDLSGRSGSLGYCKPVIRREALGGLRYDETIGIGEDFDFCLRLLAGGRRFLLWPDPSYLYRRHSASMSHRLSAGALEGQIAAQDRLEGGGPELAPVLVQRRRILDRALAYERLVAQVKDGRLAAASGAVARRPALVADLGRSLSDRRRRNRRAHSNPPGAPTHVFLIPKGDSRPETADGIALEVPPLRPAVPAADHAGLAGRLAAIAGEGPVRVTVRGAEALHGLGYLPNARRIRVELLPGETLSDAASLPFLDELVPVSGS
jgi:succinoglycan biosynthesis protein ExoO